MNLFTSIWRCWRHDWVNQRRVFCIEMVAALCSLCSAIMLAVFAGQSHMLLIYTTYISGNIGFLVSSQIRGVSWMVVLMGAYVACNSLGLLHVMRLF